MPEVTLLKPGHCDCTIFRGVQAFKFFGGIPKEVSPAIAISCQKMVENGKPLFDVKNMPEVVQNDLSMQNVEKVPRTRAIKQKNLFEGHK